MGSIGQAMGQSLSGKLGSFGLAISPRVLPPDFGKSMALISARGTPHSWSPPRRRQQTLPSSCSGRYGKVDASLHSPRVNARHTKSLRVTLLGTWRPACPRLRQRVLMGGQAYAAFRYSLQSILLHTGCSLTPAVARRLTLRRCNSSPRYASVSW